MSLAQVIDLTVIVEPRVVFRMLDVHAHARITIEKKAEIYHAFC